MRLRGGGHGRTRNCLGTSQRSASGVASDAMGTHRALGGFGWGCRSLGPGRWGRSSPPVCCGDQGDVGHVEVKGELFPRRQRPAVSGDAERVPNVHKALTVLVHPGDAERCVRRNRGRVASADANIPTALGPLNPMLKRYSLGAGQNVARTIVIVAFPCSTETTPKETRGVGVLRGASASVVQGSGSGGLVRRKFARTPPTITAPDPMTRIHGRITREVFVRPALAKDISDPQVR